MKGEKNGNAKGKKKKKKSGRGIRTKRNCQRKEREIEERYEDAEGRVSRDTLLITFALEFKTFFHDFLQFKPIY
jgi:hypothetical protein